MITTAMDANLNVSIPPFQDVNNHDYGGSGCGSQSGGNRHLGVVVNLMTMAISTGALNLTRQY